MLNLESDPVLCLNGALLGEETQAPPTKAQGRPRATGPRSCLERERGPSGPGWGHHPGSESRFWGSLYPRGLRSLASARATASASVQGLSVWPEARSAAGHRIPPTLLLNEEWVEQVRAEQPRLGRTGGAHGPSLSPPLFFSVLRPLRPHC